MSETVTATTPSSIHYKRRLEGIQVNNDTLLKLWRDAFIDIDIQPTNRTSTHSNTNSQAAATSGRHPSTSHAPNNIVEATQILLETGDPMAQNSPGTSSNKKIMPIPVLQALQILFHNKQDNVRISALEQSLKGTSLAFASPPSPTDDGATLQRMRFHKRMDRLRLKHEETKYSALTNNVQDRRRHDDDVTAKSMTFAASVGLNMIVAPLSFGCFMYFFAGGLFDYFLGDDFSSRTTGGTDIKRVIVGVVSGVAMMIIEMLLFVIRTHEFEEHNRQKKKKRGVEPFGAYSTMTPAVYSDNPSNSSSDKRNNDTARNAKIVHFKKGE